MAIDRIAVSSEIRHRPMKTLSHRVVRDNLGDFPGLGSRRSGMKDLPLDVEKNVKSYRSKLDEERVCFRRCATMPASPALD